MVGFFGSLAAPLVDKLLTVRFALDPWMGANAVMVDHSAWQLGGWLFPGLVSHHKLEWFALWQYSH